MLDLIARLLEPLLSLVAPGTGRRRLDAGAGYDPPPVEGPAPRQFGARPLRGEDHSLVRPYVVAHERRERERRRQARRRSLLIAPQGVHLLPHPTHRLGLTA
ncbi:hypothetical protein [Streptomyces capillispiralis]|uniref:Uncharacterized protein n=1 Tax=Streptomyces capillispiralis TaxID=68182 RepID=A0A561TGA2_9ACTN|nr:hypothetical protein [Streptomyces capillispiralis]TWF86122.1 hypothetical protein FHX78_113084 [Streptomyces capillispiralis]GHH91041.1 hypothetical protein GCM10017779_14980 [Streptomyces capillispiralis]